MSEKRQVLVQLVEGYGISIHVTLTLEQREWSLRRLELRSRSLDMRVDSTAPIEHLSTPYAALEFKDSPLTKFRRSRTSPISEVDGNNCCSPTGIGSKSDTFGNEESDLLNGNNGLT